MAGYYNGYTVLELNDDKTDFRPGCSCGCASLARRSLDQYKNTLELPMSAESEKGLLIILTVVIHELKAHKDTRRLTPKPEFCKVDGLTRLDIRLTYENFNDRFDTWRLERKDLDPDVEFRSLEQDLEDPELVKLYWRDIYASLLRRINAALSPFKTPCFPARYHFFVGPTEDFRGYGNGRCGEGYGEELKYETGDFHFSAIAASTGTDFKMEILMEEES